jgi:molecular chaperone DnaK
MEKIIGIDLGTTNSCAAIVENGQPKIIPSSKGYLTVPSVVAYDDAGHLLVGQPAVRQSLINPENTVYGAKRLIGRHYDSHIVQEIKKAFHYEIYRTPNDEAGVVLKGKNFTLPQVSALILKEIKKWAEEYLREEVKKAVITVPAYFNDRQRQAVREAGRLAGLEVPRIINEPTAASLAYGFGRGLEQKVVIYDLGGGTFDVSILELGEGTFQVLSTYGDTFLGGTDFDYRIVEYAMELFEKEQGIDLIGDRVALQRLKEASENAKKELSIREEATISVPYIYQDENGTRDLNMRLTREMLEKMVEPLVDKTIRICEEALDMAKLGALDIDNVILVGGQTRMPMVWRKINKFFNKPPSKGVHPDEVVALGAAIMADLIARKGQEDILLMDVVPVSFGLVLPGNKFKKIIDRNTQIPVRKTRIFTTSRNDQTSVKISVAQGESPNANENELLKNIAFRGLRPAPAGEAKVEVTFAIDADGILQITAKDKDTGKEVHYVVTSELEESQG